MIDALTAQGRFQGLILVSLPPFMFVVLMLLRREYEIILLQHPMLIVTALALLALAALWIRRIVNFDW
jgi:Flp pilus assembly protein TadB